MYKIKKKTKKKTKIPPLNQLETTNMPWLNNDDVATVTRTKSSRYIRGTNPLELRSVNEGTIEQPLSGNM